MMPRGRTMNCFFRRWIWRKSEQSADGRWAALEAVRTPPCLGPAEAVLAEIPGRRGHYWRHVVTRSITIPARHCRGEFLLRFEAVASARKFMSIQKLVVTT